MTIHEVLDKLTNKISNITSLKVVIANIANLNDNDNDVNLEKSTIVLSIVNIEEDKTLKNQSLYINRRSDVVINYEGVDYTVESNEKYKKPAQNLVFSILFSSYTKESDQYTEGLIKLDKIIRYFQHNNVFYYDDSSQEIFEYSESHPETANENKIIIDMISLKSDQLNQMWSYLGSKYMPSVLYNIRLIRIQNEEFNSSPTINNIKTQLWKNNKNDITGELESSKFSKKV